MQLTQLLGCILRRERVCVCSVHIVLHLVRGMPDCGCSFSGIWHRCNMMCCSWLLQGIRMVGVVGCKQESRVSQFCMILPPLQ